jgi:L-threonylcarbamoyladenylate synthase
MKKNDVDAAVKALQNGEIILYPTDTLYALGADIYNDTAIRNVFIIKQRPFSLPLPVAVDSIQHIDLVAYTNETVFKVSKTFLPGELTMVLKKKPSVPDLLTSGSDTIAVRIPKNSIALELLAKSGPLTITSANLHQKQTQAVINEILLQLGQPIPICLDDGKKNGTPSTIVDLTGKTPQIIRKGSITEKEILDVISHG